MANTPISGFSSGAPAQSGDELVIARSGANFKLANSDIKTLIIGAGSVSIASTKTLTANNTLTLAGTDSTTMTFPTTSATIARTDAGQTFTGNQAITGTVTASGSIGSGAGSVSAPGLYAGSATTSGLYSAASNQCNIAGNGSLLATFGGSAASVTLSVVNPLSLNNSGNIASLFVPAAATLQLGAADAAAPVAQTFKVQSVVAGTSNTAGTNFTIRGSAGTGTGAGGSIIFQVAPAGSSGTAQNAYSTALTITSSGTATFAANTVISGTFFINSDANGNDYFMGTNLYGRKKLGMSADATIGWTSVNGTPNGTNDVILARDAANTLALRNGTNAQTFFVYNTYTDASNYERGGFAWNSNQLVVSAANTAGTGVARDLLLSAANVYLRTSGNNRWQTDTNGHFLAVADNTYDIGASGANRPRHIYSAAGLTVANGNITITSGQFVSSSSGYNLNGNGFIQPSGSGIFRLVDFAGTDFNRLQFGGTTSSFPALKRSSTTLQVRLADDSADAALSAAAGTFSGVVTAPNLATGRTLGRAFTPLDNQPPASNFATLDTRNSIAVLDFDDATDEFAVFVSTIPQAATITSGLKVIISWAATSATSGDCVWGVQFAKLTGVDLDVFTFDTATTATTTTSGTSGVVNTTTITVAVADTDGLAAGNCYAMQVYRDANAGGDTMTGDAELVAVELQQVA